MQSLGHRDDQRPTLGQGSQATDLHVLDGRKEGRVPDGRDAAIAIVGRGKAQLVSEEPNPYGELPFVFFHNEEPVDGFWAAASARHWPRPTPKSTKRCPTSPTRFAFSPAPICSPEHRGVVAVREKARSTSTSRQHGGGRSGRHDGAPAEIFYLQPQILVEDTWRHIERLIQATFFDLDVPLNAVRDNGSSPTSGLQVLAEQIPLLDYLKARQRYVAKIETAVAKKILSMAGGSTSYTTRFPAFSNWSTPSRLTSCGPPLRCLSRRPERNAEDQWMLEYLMVSPIEIIMQRRGVTREQAEQIAEQITADVKAWKERNGDKGPFGQGSPVGSAQSQGEIGSIDTSQPPPTLNAEGEAENEAADDDRLNVGPSATNVSLSRRT